MASASHVPPELVLGSFREFEGRTLIVRREDADAYGALTVWLAPTVHSSLAAVGLAAAVAAALARDNTSCNVLAAYHHNPLFAGHVDAARALSTQQQLASTASAAAGG